MKMLRLSFVVMSLVACAAGSDDNAGGGPSTGGSSSEGGAAPGGAGQGGGTGGGFSSGGGNTGGFAGTPEVFGHSKSTLYKLNPETKDVGVVGPFSGCTNIIDLAIDEDSNIYVTTQDGGLYTVDENTAACTLVASGSYPNSLSFVPAGTLDPNEEALVGFLDDQYVRIDKSSGEVLPVGSPWNNGFISSGDIVSVKNGPTYLTIKDANPDDGVCGDCLVEINPGTGVIIKNYHSVGYEKVFGAAFWAGSIYGFTNAGEIFEITIENNQLTTSQIATPQGLSFWGAGSTTSAPPAPQ